MIKVSFPGKLFLMGEYAVLKTGQSAVIKSVNKFLNLSLETSNSWDIASSFGHTKGEAVFNMDHMREVSATLNTLSQYLGKNLKPAKIVIQSDLDEGDLKYGFGSSGVVIVALVSALLEHEGCEIGKLELFKLCVLVQHSIQRYSSGGDLASSIFGGVIAYSRYDLKWLQKQDHCLEDLVIMSWPSLEIRNLDLASFAHVAIGWTQKSNKTENYTEAVERQSEIDPMTYRAFLVSAQRFVSDFIKGIETQDYEMISESMRMYRGLMRELGQWADIEIETAELRNLIEESLALGIPAKVSGSGGGDCGFAILDKDNMKQLNKLKEMWNQKGIRLIEE